MGKGGIASKYDEYLHDQHSGEKEVEEGGNDCALMAVGHWIDNAHLRTTRGAPMRGDTLVPS